MYIRKLGLCNILKFIKQYRQERDPKWRVDVVRRIASSMSDFQGLKHPASKWSRTSTRNYTVGRNEVQSYSTLMRGT